MSHLQLKWRDLTRIITKRLSYLHSWMYVTCSSVHLSVCLSRSVCDAPVWLNISSTFFQCHRIAQSVSQQIAVTTFGLSTFAVFPISHTTETIAEKPQDSYIQQHMLMQLWTISAWQCNFKVGLRETQRHVPSSMAWHAHWRLVQHL